MSFGDSMVPTRRWWSVGKTIFFPGDPAEKVYLIRRGAVRLSRVYESGEEITVALLRENSLFGVLSLLTGHRSDRFYHSIAFTRVEMVTAPATSVRQAIEADTSVGLLLLQGLSSRILQTETMIETLTHRDMSSRLVSFLLGALSRFRRAWSAGHHHRPTPLTPSHRRGHRFQRASPSRVSWVISSHRAWWISIAKRSLFSIQSLSPSGSADHAGEDGAPVRTLILRSP